MSRRCKKGQRARVIGGENAGAIVLVLRPYFFPQEFDGTVWHNYRFPWAVTSLGRPLQFSYLDGNPAPPTQSGVVDDEDLQPLDDDDDGLPETEDLSLPITKSKPFQGPVASTTGDRNG